MSISTCSYELQQVIKYSQGQHNNGAMYRHCVTLVYLNVLQFLIEHYNWF